ncbi:MAG: MATE family efflux transporter [Christensenellaceae bacterium]|jgi:putative MATE family efflux protein
MKSNLLSGSPFYSLTRFAVPLLLANLLQSGYSVVDMIIVGRFVGSTGIAAISSASRMGYIIQSVCTGITTGGSVLVAQYAGAKNKEKQSETIGALCAISAITALILTIGSLFVYRPVLTAMQVPAEAYQYAADYMQIICFGTVFVIGYNAVCAVMRGLGDSRSALIFVAIAAISNVFLDILLVGALGLETKGAAIATIVSQGISVGVAVVYIKKKRSTFGLDWKRVRIIWKSVWAILKIGLPTALQMTILNFSYLIVAGLLNGYGVVIAAAAGIGLQVNTFAAIPVWGIGQAVTAATGQCIGANDVRRAKQMAKTGILLSLIIQACVIILIQFFAKQIIALFDSNPEVISEGVLYLRICCSINSFAYVVAYIINSFATGTGHSLFAMANSIFQSVVLRILMGICLSIVLGHIGIYWGESLSPVPCAAIGIVYWAKGKWKKPI